MIKQHYQLTDQLLNRRRFLLSLTSAMAGASLVNLGGCQLMPGKSIADWRMADRIRQSVTMPLFPSRDFDIRQFGASVDSIDNSQAIVAAIKACHLAGGGRVLVTSGRYLTGPVHLLSNVNLHIDESACLAFVTDPKAYLPAVHTRWEGMEIMGYSPLIYARNQQNIAITGKGILDGQANKTTWWPWKGNNFSSVNWGIEGVPTQAAAREKLMQDVEANRPVAERIYADGSYLRPTFIQPYECKNLLIQDVTITNAPFWLLNPVLCENVTIDGVTLSSHGPNSDGCDPESCKNVIIKNCLFDTGDDCIAIKSGRNADGRRINIPSENILIENCKMRSGHGGVVIGSEISGGARNIFVQNCEMSSPDLERGIRIKTNSVRGGLIENFFIRNVKIGEVQTAIVIDFQYEEGDAGKFTPVVRNIEIRNLICDRAHKVFQVRGYVRAPVTSLHMYDCEFKQVDDPGVIETLSDFKAEQVKINGVAFSL